MTEQRKGSGKWHARYLEIARVVAAWSKHPEFQVGAVAIGDYGQVLSTGYNGWPRNITGEEQFREGESWRAGWQDAGGIKDPSLTIHAEANVIYNASLTGVSLARSTLYVYPMFPCVECAKALVQVGVGQICYVEAFPLDEAEAKWKSSWAWAGEMFREAGVAVTRIDG
jgi:dCMP deaminase